MTRLEFRGLRQSTYKRFLLELGGKEKATPPSVQCGVAGPVVIEGKGWLAHLEPEDTLVFSKGWRIPRTFIVFSGDPETVSRIVAQFRLKALRGGG